MKGDDAWEDDAQGDDDARGDGLQNDARGGARQRGACDGGQDIDDAEEASQSADGEAPSGEEAPGGT